MPEELNIEDRAGSQPLSHLRVLLAALPDLWFVIDTEGRYAEVSRPDHPSLSMPWERTVGRPFAEVLPTAVARRVSAAWARVRAGGSTERIEYRLSTLLGEERVFEARVVPMVQDAGCLLLVRDITESVAALQSLRDSEARYERALRGTTDGLWDWDVKTGRDYLSPRWKELLGFAPHELHEAAGNFLGRLHPDDLGPVRATLQAHFQHGAPFDIEVRLRTKSGDWRWFRSRGEAERGADGAPLRMAGSIADITSRKQIEDALRDSQAQFSAIFQTAPVGIVLTSIDGCLPVEVNEEMGRILGYAPAEMVGRDTVELGIWTSVAVRAAFIERALRDGRASLSDLEMRHCSGHAVHARMSMQPLRVNGQPMLLGALTDITDRYAAEQALYEQRQAYEAVFNGASDAIVSVDVHGIVMIFNPAAERIFHRSAASVLGQPVDMLLPPDQREKRGSEITAFAATRSTGRVMGAGRVTGLRADGQVLELEASISHAQFGGRTVLTAILRDVTERVRAEAESLRYQLELSALTRQLMDQEKQTTQGLAQALHDQLGQTLAALRIALDRGRGAPAVVSPGRVLHQEQVSGLLDQAIAQVRSVLVDLRPPLLEEEGLYAALDNEVATRAALHAQIDVLLDASDAARAQRWPAEVEYALFMIAREALDNGLRHARGTLVRVALAGNACRAELEVSDDGVGIGSNADRARAGHLGLIGMRERARAIGAVLAFEPADGGGTCLTVTWSDPR